MILVALDLFTSIDTVVTPKVDVNFLSVYDPPVVFFKFFN